MAADHIRYDLLAQEALRGVLRTVLSDAAKHGLPGDHHFFVTFDTCADGVRLSQRMRAQYPKEMTIVLQHQFWDLTVSEEAFEVGLSFGGIPERLSVPFAAVKQFLDPSVEFGLQFEQIGATGPEADAKPGPQPSVPGKRGREADAGEPGNAPPQGKSRRTTPAVPTPANPQTSASDDQAGKPGDKPAEKSTGGGEVVRLDRFRKK
ncbi:MAG TPA: ClpXP protease specificity-enhancing factor SspB [Xanthobacteraceae bacterium]